MSRVGKQELQIPTGVTVELKEGGVFVRGKKGELSKKLRKEVSVSVDGGVVRVAPTVESIFARALWGTTTSHIQNMIQGVTEGFEKKLEIHGVGYRAEVTGDTLKMSLGYSHPVLFSIPKDLTVSVEKNVITVSGHNKEEVGQFCANVRKARKPEPYKGKGVRYQGEFVRIKEGKKNA